MLLAPEKKKSDTFPLHKIMRFPHHRDNLIYMIRMALVAFNGCSSFSFQLKMILFASSGIIASFCLINMPIKCPLPHNKLTHIHI